MGYLDLEDLAKELDELSEREEPDEEDKERLAALRSLEGQLFTGDLHQYARNVSTLIPEEEFEDYAQEWADGVGYIGDMKENPLSYHVDWAAWAEDLKQDYTEVTFDGDTYLIRAY